MRTIKYALFLLGFVLSVNLAFAGSKVNINTADAHTLSTELKGVGASKAKAIVSYREKNGPFASIDALANVEGIGEKILELNKDKLTVSESKAETAEAKPK